MESLPSADNNENENSTAVPHPAAWYDSWNNLGGLNADTSQMSLSSETSAGSPFSPHPQTFFTGATNSGIISPLSWSDCSSSPNTQWLDPRWCRPPYAARSHNTNFVALPSHQPINAMDAASLYNHPKPINLVTCIAACSSSDAAQSTSPPPTASASSKIFPSSPPPNPAAGRFNPAVPNFVCDTFAFSSSTTWAVEDSENSKDILIMDAFPERKAVPLADTDTDTDDLDSSSSPPPAKKPRTRASQRAKEAKANKARKMNSQQESTSKEEGGGRDRTPEGHPPPPPQQGGISSEEQARVREWHNCIGKKYRNKLNDQFESLQTTLVAVNGATASGSARVQDGGGDDNADGGADVDGDGNDADGEGHGKRGHLNKAKVLDMAKVTIENLTKQREALIKEEEELRAKGVEE